ncbi:hypothetical protein [Streptomyces sp. NPDC010273]|uniref:hypothetical protein n=1 Tax=Streptomyces sp. NPDC010273 TaxID=3364829 RepID=UPI0036E47E07
MTAIPTVAETGVRPVEWWDGVPVPAITARSGEAPPPQPLMRQRTRLGFTDEVSTDRQYDVLWMRMPARPRGEPDYEFIHGLRQRAAMARMLCQVCYGPTPASVGKPGLFLLGAAGGRPICDGEPTASPPVHAACARSAVEYCRPLSRGWSAALVENTPVWGVAGTLYDPRTLAAVPPPDGRSLHRIGFADARIPWVLASRLMITLEGVTPVANLEDLSDAELAAASAASGQLQQRDAPRVDRPPPAPLTGAALTPPVR